MIRASPFRLRPDENWNILRENLNQTTFYLVHRCPTVFSLKNEDGESFKLVLGNPHSCSCGAKDLCIHFLYVLLKVLRVPENNHLCWQLCFTDSDINSILNIEKQDKRSSTRTTRQLKSSSSVAESATAIAEYTVSRQVLDDDVENLCPICQDEMSKDQALTYCRKQCGNNIHAKCMKMFAQYKISNHDAIECPLCRVDWGITALQIILEDCKGKASLKHSCAPVNCYSCTLSIRGIFYRCLQCSMSTIKSTEDNCGNNIAKTCKTNTAATTHSSFDFCKRCFEHIGREHSRHVFVSSDTSMENISDVIWQPARNPRVACAPLVVDNLLDLQNRDLTAADYDILLGLDRTGQTPLPVHLLKSLLPVNTGSQSSSSTSFTSIKCCFCQLNVMNLSLVQQSPVKALPCAHYAHESCLTQKLNQILSEEGCSGLTTVRCNEDGCSKAVFGCLSRRRKRKTTTAAVEIPGTEDGRKEEGEHVGGKQDVVAIALGVAGVGVGGSGLSNQTADRIDLPMTSSVRQNRNSVRPHRVYRNYPTPTSTRTLGLTKLSAASLEGLVVGGAAAAGAGLPIPEVRHRQRGSTHSAPEFGIMRRDVVHGIAQRNTSSITADDLPSAITTFALGGTPVSLATSNADGREGVTRTRPPLNVPIRGAVIRGTNNRSNNSQSAGQLHGNADEVVGNVSLCMTVNHY